MRRLWLMLAAGVVLATATPAGAASLGRDASRARRPATTTTTAVTPAATPDGAVMATGVDADVLEPTLSCTSHDDPGPGIDTTVFGYVNRSKGRVTLPTGTWNVVSDAPGAKPPTVFEPGRHPHAFEAHVARGVATRWSLGTGEVAGPGPRCKGRISPVLTSSIMRATAFGAAPLTLLWGVFAFKRRREQGAARAARAARWRRASR